MKNQQISVKNSDAERTVTKLSVVLVVLVFIVKMVSVLFTNSLSFLSEFVDSIMDFLVVGITFVALKKSRKPADRDHMFGHYKFNSFAGLVVSLITLSIYVAIFYQSVVLIYRVIVGNIDYTIDNPTTGIISLILVICINGVITRKINTIGMQTNNSSIKAQAINFKGDFFRNIAVIFGLFCAYFGIFIIDPILAASLSVKVFIETFNVTKQAYNELMDYNPIPENQIQKVENKINRIDGVRSLENLAISAAGSTLHVDLTLSIDHNKSIYTADEISRLVRNKICSEFPNYECSVLINLKSAPPTQLKAIYWEIMDIIRQSSEKFSGIEDVHSISLDVLQDVILIHLHIHILPELKLRYAHELCNLFEEHIRDRIIKKIKKPDIKIISHIEPAEHPEKIHYHKEPNGVSESFKCVFEQILKTLPEIHHYDKLNLLNESDGLYLYVNVYLDGETNVYDTHNIIARLEHKLRRKYKNLKKTMIHSEPYLPGSV